MAHKRVNDEEMLIGLLEAFRIHGYEGASLAILSKATGLKRASLYHRFPGGKADMVKAVFGYIAEWYENTIMPILSGSAAPEHKLQRILAELRAFFAHGRKSCLFEMLSSGNASALFQEQLNGSLSKWLQMFTQIAQEAGFSGQQAERRGSHALALVHGGLVMARGMNDPAVFTQSLDEIPAIFFG